MLMATRCQKIATHNSNSYGERSAVIVGCNCCSSICQWI